MEITDKIRKIRLEKSITQKDIANAIGFDVANYNRIEKGAQNLTVNQLAIIASLFKMSIIDIIAYPKKYVDSELITQPERISVTFEVSPDKRDFLLNLVTKKE